jgi:hypothetical protein
MRPALRLVLLLALLASPAVAGERLVGPVTAKLCILAI